VTEVDEAGEAGGPRDPRAFAAPRNRSHRRPSVAGDRSGARRRVQGCGAALREVFLTPAATLDSLLPHELLLFDVLDLKRAKAADDFRRALLVTSRLGKLCS